MANKISCREGVYGGWKQAAEYLPRAGVKYIELEAGKPDLQQAADYCRSKDVIPLTISGSLDCMKEESIAAVKAACDAAEAIGVGHYFLSAHGDDRAASMRVLAQLGEYAAKRGVVICLETHPPFCLNGDEMLKTMAEVGHPNVRINFDTANIMYYNHGCDSVEELGKVAEYVASVHLKDTDGGYNSFNFPVFGEGVIDFAGIFKILHSVGFDGPLTMELEGPLVDGLPGDERNKKVIACVDHLKSIGEA